MPSAGNVGNKLRPIKTWISGLRDFRFRSVPEIAIDSGTFAAAQLTGANSGFFVFTAPAKFAVLGGSIIWATAGTNTLRLKKVVTAATSAAGAAADASNVDISSAVDLTLAANTARDLTITSTGMVHVLEAGDKLAIASSAGTASLAGARVTIFGAFL
jgi:hypothetical protein